MKPKPENPPHQSLIHSARIYKTGLARKKHRERVSHLACMPRSLQVAHLGSTSPPLSYGEPFIRTSNTSWKHWVSPTHVTYRVHTQAHRAVQTPGHLWDLLGVPENGWRPTEPRVDQRCCPVSAPLEKSGSFLLLSPRFQAASTQSFTDEQLFSVFSLSFLSMIHILPKK